MSIIFDLTRGCGLRKDQEGIVRRGKNSVYELLEVAKEQNRLAEERNRPSMNYGLSRDILNLEELFAQDLGKNIGFIIDESIDYYKLMSDKAKTEESKLRELDSIFSYKFGNYKKENQTYTCDCGHTVTNVAGEQCELCKTFTDKRIYRRGWLVLKNGFKVFNPDYFNLLLKNIDVKKLKMSKKNFQASLVDTHTSENKYNLLSLMNKEVLREFINEYVVDRMKDFLLDRIDRAMTKAIPVISSNYRFYRVEKTLNSKKPNVKYHEYNSKYVRMSNTVNNINSLGEHSSFASKMINLENLTKLYMELYKLIMNDLGKDKKRSYLRGKTSGKYKPASCKVVIDCASGLQVDECMLPYHIFGVMVNKYYKQDLKELGLSPEGFKRLETFRPTTSDKIILVLLLKRLKAKKLNFCTILRAPSIYINSIYGCKIAGLTNYDSILVNDMTLGCCLRGDKDGDTAICVLSIPKIGVAEFFAYHPSKSIFLSLTGEINDSFEVPESQYYTLYGAFKSAEGREMTDNNTPPTVGYGTKEENPIFKLIGECTII